MKMDNPLFIGLPPWAGVASGAAEDPEGLKSARQVKDRFGSTAAVSRRPVLSALSA